uniref:PIR Superfamily Protein n=1 Tax=Strongyloides papillosus TaxID=174720 RepID=A0A0N5BVN5_STREA
MDKNLSNNVPPYSQLYNLDLSFNKPLELNLNYDSDIINENCTQEDSESSESTTKMENITATKSEESNDKISSSAKNIDVKDSPSCKSQYVMTKIDEPVNNETIVKSSNQANSGGYWGFGIVSSYVMDGLQKIYPNVSSSLRETKKNDSQGINKTSTKKSMYVVNECNKSAKEQENITTQDKLLDDKSKTISNDLNRGTYGYLPNWDTLVGATSNLVETTTSVVSLTTNVLKSATEVGIKNIKSINQKNNYINKAQNQSSHNSSSISCQENLKSFADYDYIDLVSVNKQLSENGSNNNKI